MYKEQLHVLVDKFTEEQAEAAWLIIANMGTGNGPSNAVRQVARVLTEQRNSEDRVPLPA